VSCLEESVSGFDSPVGRVVVGVDCTPTSQVLLRWADRQAALTGSTLVAVTGWRIETPGIDDFLSVPDVLDLTRRALADTVVAALPAERAAAVEFHVSDLVPAEALMEQSTGADLVVVGPRSANVIEGLLLGSVTECVVSQASCPVAVVHHGAGERSQRIVVGLDGSECSRRALDWAVRQAILTDSRVEAIWAWEWTPQYGVYPYGADEATVEKTARARLEHELATLPATRASVVGGQLCRGHPARVLLNASAGADLVVVGNHRAGPLSSRMLGSVSQKVVRHASVPVVVVHEHDHMTVEAG